MIGGTHYPDLLFYFFIFFDSWYVLKIIQARQEIHRRNREFVFPEQLKALIKSFIALSSMREFDELSLE